VTATGTDDRLDRLPRNDAEMCYGKYNVRRDAE
jgi:hypothetical protein